MGQKHWLITTDSVTVWSFGTGLSFVINFVFSEEVTFGIWDYTTFKDTAHTHADSHTHKHKNNYNSRQGYLLQDNWGGLLTPDWSTNLYVTIDISINLSMLPLSKLFIPLVNYKTVDLEIVFSIKATIKISD